MNVSLLLGLLAWTWFPSLQFSNDSYSTKHGNVSLVFDLTVGKMDATTNEANSTLDISTEAVLFNMKINAFKFSNPILEQQFKNVYMEVDKYPETTFAGKIKEGLDFKYSKPQHVHVDGVLGMHGITKPMLIPATITIGKENIHVVSEFLVKASEYSIDIPVAFFKNGKDEIKVVIDVLYSRK